MASPVARIRPFTKQDERQVRFMIGKANMELLAVANRRAYIHPFLISVWLALSTIFMEMMGWWPRSGYGIWGYLSPLRAFATLAVPLMFFVDWINRPFFEKRTQQSLQGLDMHDILSHYARSPASGFWVLDYGSELVGLIAFDAAPEDSSPKKLHSATIRHFCVDEMYRRAGIQDDLVEHAISFGFEADPRLDHVHAHDSPLAPYVRASFKKAGFQLVEYTDKVGILGWKFGARTLDRKEWAARRLNKS